MCHTDGDSVEIKQVGGTGHVSSLRRERNIGRTQFLILTAVCLHAATAR